MVISVQGWSHAGPWLNLSNNFGGFIFFSKNVGPSHITKRKTKKVSVGPIFAWHRQYLEN